MVLRKAVSLSFMVCSRGRFIDDGIGQGFQYEGLVVYRLCQVSDRWRRWQWHSSFVLVHFLFSERVLSVPILRSSYAKGCSVPTVGGS